MRNPRDPLLTEAKKRIGQRVRKWTLEELIDVGGMAAVFVATHDNGNRVAMKVLHAHVAAHKEAHERFLREGYVANKVQHPNAVTVLDDDTLDDGTPYLVMELLEGVPLENRLRTHPVLPPGEVLYIADQLLDVLEAAHEHNIVHRDVKPPNVYLTSSGHVKLLDFGLARVTDGNRSLTQTGMVLGTVSFMSPEQARGRHNLVDHRADIFSVGAVMFRALTGRNVHIQRNPTDRLMAAMTETAPPLESIVKGYPTLLSMLTNRALAFQRDGRWPDCKTMREVLALAYKELLGRELPKPHQIAESGLWEAPASKPSSPAEEFEVSVSFEDDEGENSIVVRFDDGSGQRQGYELLPSEALQSIHVTPEDG